MSDDKERPRCARCGATSALVVTVRGGSDAQGIVNRTRSVPLCTSCATVMLERGANTLPGWQRRRWPQ